MADYKFLDLQEAHLPVIREIYNYYVKNSTATFHTQPLTPSEMRELVFFNNPKYQTYAICHGEQVCGYVLLTRHKKRAAYGRTAEVTLYLAPGFTGMGIGSQALHFIEERARLAGFHLLVATICGENLPSIGLFTKNGYTQCAHYHEVGRKFERWLDSVAFEKIL
ncbi:MAG: GNAT family N-acetyltransferase [Bacillota bacterium]|jgi:L-amino acid N-acyltransferase YncA